MMIIRKDKGIQIAHIYFSEKMVGATHYGMILKWAKCMLPFIQLFPIKFLFNGPAQSEVQVMTLYLLIHDATKVVHSQFWAGEKRVSNGLGPSNGGAHSLLSIVSCGCSIFVKKIEDGGFFTRIIKTTLCVGFICIRR